MLLLAVLERRVKEMLNTLIPLMVRQAHHERNQSLAVRPEPFVFAQDRLVEGLVQQFLKM